MSDPKIAISNVDSIEEYLKNKYQFLSDKSPYSQPDFLQKPDEKSPLPVKKSHDETLDITIFHDLQVNNKDPENLQRKYENLNKEGFNYSQAPPQKQANAGLSSDPKINKLLADVENIVQKATGKAPLHDQGSNSTESKFGLGSKFGGGMKKNSDIENHEIRAYLKNLDSKLNILAPKKDREEKENHSKRIPLPHAEERSKANVHKEDSSFSSNDSETSPSFRQKSRKKEPKSTMFMNNRNSVNRDGKKPENHNKSKDVNSPSKNSNMMTRNGRSSSRHIFEKLPAGDHKIKEIAEMDKNLTRHALHQKALLEMENNVFCVNCEEFINEGKIDEHSTVCHKTSNHRVPSSDNNYNSMRTCSNDLTTTNYSTQQFSVAGQIKNVNEHLNKITAILLQKIKFFENIMMMPTCDPNITSQIISLLAHFLDLTLNIIHNKDPITISQISKSLHEIFVNLSEISYISPDVLQVLQKIKQHCKLKYEILDPNNSYYNAISTNKNTMFNNPANFQRFSTIQSFNNRLTSYISDTVSNATYSRSNNNRVINNLNSPSDNSNNSDIYNNNNSKMLKKKFFKMAIAAKLVLQNGHPGHQVNLSDLFLECLQMKLAENEWEEFLEQKLNLSG